VLVRGLRGLLNFAYYVCSGRLSNPAELAELAIYAQALTLTITPYISNNLYKSQKNPD